MEQKADHPQKTAAPAWIAGGLAFLCYAVTLGGTWIYDDILILRVDERLKNSIKFLQFWSESYHNGVDNLYRPLVSTTYALQLATPFSSPFYLHAVNLMLHVVATILVVRLAQRLLDTKTALFAGVIFAAHPIHVEAVANIVGRAELMCAIGVLGAMILILRRPFTTRAAIGVVLCFVLSILSKEQGMLLPLLLASLWLTTRREQNTSDDLQRLKTAAASICILLGGYVVLRENILGLKFWWDRNFLDWTINPLVRPDADRALMPLVLLGRYVALLIAPLKLSPDYGATVIGWQVNWTEPWVYIGVAAIVTWIVFLLIAFKLRNGPTIFCLLALAITYGIVGNVVSLIGVNFAERLMYLPSIFFILIVAMLLARLPSRLAMTLTIAIVLLASVRTITYAAKWNDSTSFYEYCIQQQPKAIRLYMLLTSDHLLRGEDDRKRGDLAAANADFSKAKQSVDASLKILPEYDELWIEAASVAIAQKDFDAADVYLDKALELAKADRRRSMIKASNWKTKVEELRKASTQPVNRN
jgi:hypothetical protein